MAGDRGWTLFIVNKLPPKMIALDGTDDVSKTKWLKARLKERYQDHVYFSEVNEKSNVVLEYHILPTVWFLVQE